MKGGFMWTLDEVVGLLFAGVGLGTAAGSMVAAELLPAMLAVSAVVVVIGGLTWLAARAGQ
jgi:hypothetical protein